MSPPALKPQQADGSSVAVLRRHIACLIAVLLMMGVVAVDQRQRRRVDVNDFFAATGTAGDSRLPGATTTMPASAMANKRIAGLQSGAASSNVTSGVLVNTTAVPTTATITATATTTTTTPAAVTLLASSTAAAHATRTPPTPPPRPTSAYHPFPLPPRNPPAPPEDMDGDLAVLSDEGPPPLRRRARIRDDAAFAARACGVDRVYAAKQAADACRSPSSSNGANHNDGGGGSNESPEASSPPRARIAILTFADDGMSDVPRRVMLCDAQWNHRQYALRHGYDMLWEDASTVQAAGRTGHWNKLVAIARWLPHYDWVMWIDADALFLNQAISIESVIRSVTEPRSSSPPAPGDARENVPTVEETSSAPFVPPPPPPAVQLIVARDKDFYNTGVMIIRGGPDSDADEFLRMAYHYPRATEHPLDDLNFWEQAPMNFLLDGIPRTNFTVASGWAAVAPSRLLNARVGDHWPVGMENAHRADTLVLHYPAFRGVRTWRRTGLGPMAFARGAVLASVSFADQGAAEVESCCVFRKNIIVARSRDCGENATVAAASLSPTGVSREVPRPSAAMMELLQTANPPWRRS